MLQLTPAAMRILITADCVGGVWRYAADIGRTLAGRGAEVAIAGIGPKPSEAQRAEAAEPGLELVWLPGELDWMAAGPEGVRAAAAALDRLAAEWEPSVLHLNAPPLAAHISTRCAVLAASHSCVSTWWRAVRESPPPADWDWHRKATAAGFAAADAVVVPSAAYGRALGAVYGHLPHLKVVWNGSSGIRPAAKQPYVLGAGRWWDDSKNLAVLDAAAPTCRWPVRLAGPVAGPNGTLAEAAHVALLGDLPYSRIRVFLAEAAIFVSPSIYEPFGLAVLEAASAGAALVLSDIPTFRELWDGCARFAAPRDPEAFAQAINALAGDEEERMRLGTAARSRASRYALSRQVDGLLSVYGLAIRARQGAA